jgi:hypothetical protein
MSAPCLSQVIVNGKSVKLNEPLYVTNEKEDVVTLEDKFANATDAPLALATALQTGATEKNPVTKLGVKLPADVLVMDDNQGTFWLAIVQGELVQVAVTVALK